MIDCKFEQMYPQLYPAIKVEIHNAVTDILDRIYKVHPEIFDDRIKEAIDKARKRQPFRLCGVCRTGKINNKKCELCEERFEAVEPPDRQVPA